MKLHRFLFIILIVILPLGQFSRITLGSSGLVIYLNDLLLPLIIGFWVVDLLRRKEKFKPPYLSLPILLFLLVGIISLFWNKQYLSLNEFLISSLYLWRWFTYIGLYFVVFDLIKKLKDHQERIKETRLYINLLIGTGFLVALFGLVQYVIFPNFASMVAQGWDPHYYRVLSTFFDPNYVGGFLVLNFVLIVLMSLEVDSWEKFDLIKAGIAVVILTAIVLTFSRSTYLMFVIAMFIVGVIRSRQLLILGILVGILAFLLIPRVQERVIGGFNIDTTASFRFESWEKGLDIAKKNLLLGVSYNSYRYAQIRYDYIQPWEESEVTSHLATTGVTGLLIYLWFLGRQLIICGISYIKNSSSWSRILGITVFAGVISLIIHSQFVNSLLYPFILEWVMIVIGIMEGIMKDRI
ncbi:MAG: O-antigen polymerase [candidate division CPR3 bacterium GW2011_GWE2_35_7]|nr:MAG: O-antigen polymerase [candidate division CPR3 bacterium GW2011_GWE2_35_7]